MACQVPGHALRCSQGYYTDKHCSKSCLFDSHGPRHPPFLLPSDLPAQCNQDINNLPLQSLKDVWFTDRSSFVLEGHWKAGYAGINWGPPGTSAKNVELIAIAWALIWGRSKKPDGYTDSKYTSLVLHAHATIRKKGGFLTNKQS